MNPALQRIIDRQTAWQASRARLSWPEKIRLAESMRDSILALRKKVGVEMYPTPRPPPAHPRTRP